MTPDLPLEPDPTWPIDLDRFDDAAQPAWEHPSGASPTQPYAPWASPIQPYASNGPAPACQAAPSTGPTHPDDRGPAWQAAPSTGPSHPDGAWAVDREENLLSQQELLAPVDPNWRPGPSTVKRTSCPNRNFSPRSTPTGGPGPTWQPAAGASPTGQGGLTRRRFIVGAAGVGVVGAAALALTQQPWRRLLPAKTGTSSALSSGKGILVVVTLYGGNDGLNTVIPYTDGHYLGGRPTLGYQPQEVLPLADGLGLHPNLGHLKTLWDTKRLAIVRGVGYPNPVLSHFRSMDIWQSGSPDTPVATGVLGRWLDATGTDPMRAISLGSTLPRLLTGEKAAGTAMAGTGITLPGGSRLVPILSSLDAPGPDRSALAARVATSGSDLIKVQHTLAELLSHDAGATPPTTANGATPSTAPAPAAKAGKPAAKRASATGLAGQLDIVARLINAGSPSRVYQVSMGGFDNHAQEKDTHGRLMTELDTAIGGFMTAMQGSQAGAGVVLMTYSEFGRRVAQNGSGGTDHGTAAPLFIAGAAVKGGQFYGAEPTLADLDDGNLRFSTDFRSVYATMLGGVVGVDPKVALDGNFPILNLI